MSCILRQHPQPSSVIYRPSSIVCRLKELPMPLVPLAGAWLVGVLLGTLWPGLTPGRALVAGAAVVLSTATLPLLWGDRRARWIALGLVAGWLGLARTLLALPDPTPAPDSLRALNVPAAEARSVIAPRQHL